MVLAAAKGRAKQALEHGEGRFDLPTLAVCLLREVTKHLSAVPAGDGVGLAVQPRPTAQRGREDAHHAEFLPAETMGRLRLIPGVAHQRLDLLTLDGRKEGVGEFDVIGLRTSIDEGRKNQVRPGVADGRKLRIPVLIVAFVLLASLRVVGRDVSRFQPRRIDCRHFSGILDQAAPAGESHGCVQEP